MEEEEGRGGGANIKSHSHAASMGQALTVFEAKSSSHR